MDKYKTIFEERLERHNYRMQETVEEDMVELTRALFEETFDKLKKKPGDKYKFITMAGESLKVALFHLYSIVWKKESIPKEWSESTVIQLKKVNYHSNDLNDFRHIHTRTEYAKFLGQMVLTLAKPSIFANMPKYQIACRPGHRATEHLFIIKSVIAKYLEEKRGLLLINWDIS